MNRLAETTDRQLQRALNELELGDKKPSQHLRRMRSLVGNSASEDVLRILSADRETISKPTFTVSRAAQANTSREASEILDEDIRNITKTQPGRASGTRRTFQRGRVDNLRRDKGAPAEAELSKALQNKLYPGVKNEQTAADRLEVVSTFKAITLCITTRSIGFGTISTFHALFGLHNVPQRGNIYQFYRLSLALLESKMQYCQRGVQMIMENIEDYQQLHNSADFMQTCKTKPIMPDPITRTINAIGNIKVYDKQYYPKFAVNRTDDAGAFIPQSEHVTFSNLKKTVAALANVETPEEIRRRFYNNNPMPGAIWTDNCVLTNPNDIMPDDYDVQQLSDDMDDIQPKIDFLAKKMPKYFTEPINYDFEVVVAGDSLSTLVGCGLTWLRSTWLALALASVNFSLGVEPIRRS